MFDFGFVARTLGRAVHILRDAARRLYMSRVVRYLRFLGHVKPPMTVCTLIKISRIYAGIMGFLHLLVSLRPTDAVCGLHGHGHGHGVFILATSSKGK